MSAETAVQLHSEGQQYSRDQIELIKRTVAKGATDDELRLFLYQAKRSGLDPLANQIKGIKRWNKDENRETMAIQVGIDGYRLVADRTGERDGTDDPQWCGEDGIWRDVWIGDKPPIACRIRVHRRGHSKPYVGIAYYRFYVQKKRDGNPNRFWLDGAENMLAKCAEALALRQAFPQELSGIYTHEEMAQADSETPAPTPRASVLPPTAAVPPAPSPAAAPGGDAKHPPAPPQPGPADDEDEHALRDELWEVCEKIGKTCGAEPAAILHDLTSNKEGKFGKQRTADIPYKLHKSDGKEWSPLKAALKKAKAELEAALKAGGG